MGYTNATMQSANIISPTQKMYARYLALLTLVLLMAACSSAPKQSTVSIKTPDKVGSYLDRQDNSGNLIDT